ncbi:hypothetical protein QNM99_13860 [Pseudomonas sp. PCH446]
MKEKHSVSSYFIKALLVRFLDRPQRIAELLQAAALPSARWTNWVSGLRPGCWRNSG